MPFAGSITGVPVMPISGVMSFDPTSLLTPPSTQAPPIIRQAGTVLTPRAGFRKLVRQSVSQGDASASNAKTLSFSVATKTTL